VAACHRAAQYTLTCCCQEAAAGLKPCIAGRRISSAAHIIITGASQREWLGSKDLPPVLHASASRCAYADQSTQMSMERADGRTAGQIRCLPLPPAAPPPPLPPPLSLLPGHCCRACFRNHSRPLTHPCPCSLCPQDFEVRTRPADSGRRVGAVDGGRHLLPGLCDGPHPEHGLLKRGR
jgi:hypothetical protein